jgi:1-aminocyclopropane-1-carboxylate deaminase
MELKSPPIQEIVTSELLERDLSLKVLRLDLLHKEISGNKWYKLKYNLEYALSNKLPIVTFGGPYSNHIAATAAAGRIFKIKAIGIIRGESVQNKTLEKAMQDGMQLIFIPRNEYKEKDTQNFISNLNSLTGLGQFHLIPEGGNNHLGYTGSKEIMNDINDFDFVCLACGTGTTLAGVVSSIKGAQQAIGFTVLKNKEEIIKNVNTFIGDGKRPNFIVNDSFHFGGYSKYNKELLDFINGMKEHHQLSLDHVYTGKMFFGLMKMVKENFFSRGSRIIAIHTGGLQGSLPELGN